MNSDSSKEVTAQNTFNLRMNIYVPKGFFKDENFPRWLISCGCMVMVGSSEVRIYSKDLKSLILNPENYLDWVKKQYHYDCQNYSIDVAKRSRIHSVSSKDTIISEKRRYKAPIRRIIDKTRTIIHL